ncbi:50S ribosomal protein L23 [Candidatus Pacearchaeota archaeon]|nr:50S ribosomal protein L23 [Candidatus Pacearchaeota archaeon]
MMLKYPLSTEKAVRMIEAQNTIAFVVDRRATKKQIKEEIEENFKVSVEKISTLIRDNKKIAHIRLDKKFKAIDIATKLGLM